jgi:hypothetical protein
MICQFCGGNVEIESPRFGFFVSQCDNCEREQNGFLSVADMIEQAEPEIER